MKASQWYLQEIWMIAQKSVARQDYERNVYVNMKWGKGYIKEEACANFIVQM